MIGHILVTEFGGWEGGKRTLQASRDMDPERAAASTLSEHNLSGTANVFSYSLVRTQFNVVHWIPPHSASVRVK